MTVPTPSQLARYPSCRDRASCRRSLTGPPRCRCIAAAPDTPFPLPAAAAHPALPRSAGCALQDGGRGALPPLAHRCAGIACWQLQQAFLSGEGIHKGPVMNPASGPQLAHSPYAAHQHCDARTVPGLLPRMLCRPVGGPLGPSDGDGAGTCMRSRRAGQRVHRTSRVQTPPGGSGCARRYRCRASRL